jgi:hypothetical protein
MACDLHRGVLLFQILTLVTLGGSQRVTILSYAFGGLLDPFLPALTDRSALVLALVAAAGARAWLARLQDLPRRQLDPISIVRLAAPPQLGDRTAPAADALSMRAAVWQASHLIISSKAGATRSGMIIASRYLCVSHTIATRPHRAQNQ